ncbi:MAG: hypothetical protein KIS95_09245 [Anaerolineae bacterium]|uniref:glutaredoxin domain-containing protein n=1 Tax=Promineifilum sp. TaxID=2664178 RepID=UPI001D7E5443|nr:hypothetical protein [Anaerolineales bacterium]MCB8935819.1 hypothetical protein [Promineifilum sp.]MCO5180442.1 glutathione S-transferase N-terminal domain-containing protein [Promineifilum sp.]MCW5847402.1 hypothetical protein [Anaerolineae bacterium]
MEEVKQPSNPQATLLVYGRPFCPGVPPVRQLLDAAGVAYDYVDIREDREAAARLREITGGYESVPTLVFADGRTLVEPSAFSLRRALQEGGQGGAALDSPVAAVRAGLSNPVYWVMALLALALMVAFWLSG